MGEGGSMTTPEETAEAFRIIRNFQEIGAVRLRRKLKKEFPEKDDRQIQELINSVVALVAPPSQDDAP